MQGEFQINFFLEKSESAKSEPLYPTHYLYTLRNLVGYTFTIPITFSHFNISPIKLGFLPKPKSFRPPFRIENEKP